MADICKSHPEAFRRGPWTAGNFRPVHNNNNNSGIGFPRKFDDIGGDFASDGPPAKRRRDPDCVIPMWRREEEKLCRLSLREDKDSNGNERRVEEEDQPSCSEGSDVDVYYTREAIERLSPSRRDGINCQNETILRFSYVSFLQNLGMRLQLPPMTVATAIVLCHRFFLRRSHAAHDRFLIATACMFLVAKSEDTPRPLNSVLIVSYEICHKHDLANFHYLLPNDWFEQYKQRVLDAENLVLTTLDFELTVQHPYRPLVSVLNKIGFAQTALVHVAWNLITEGKLPNEVRIIRMTKKDKEISQTSVEDSDMPPLFSDMTCNKDCDNYSWEEMYQLFEEEQPRVIVKIATTHATISSDLSYFDVACSFLHRIATSPKILPYRDMIKWVIDHLKITYRSFKNSKLENISSFIAEDLRTTYHLPMP